MTFKILGALLVLAGCGGFGLMIATNHAREVRTLRQLISLLDFMECELQYRYTPLPELCRQAAGESTSILQMVFMNLAMELEDQISPDVQRCMVAALEKSRDIPKFTRKSLLLLGSCMGRFDMDGQLKGLDNVRAECRRVLENLMHDQDNRLRSYQTLGICAGAAIAILFI